MKLIVERSARVVCIIMSKFPSDYTLFSMFGHVGEIPRKIGIRFRHFSWRHPTSKSRALGGARKFENLNFASNSELHGADTRAWSTTGIIVTTWNSTSPLQYSLSFYHSLWHFKPSTVDTKHQLPSASMVLNSMTTTWIVSWTNDR